MGVRLIEDREDGQTVMYCSVTDVAFGPVFPNRETAQKFLDVTTGDPRLLTPADLSKRYTEFVMSYVCECGQVREDEQDCYDCKNGIDKTPDGRTHIDRDGDKCRCFAQPAPPQGERWACGVCQQKRELKAARAQRQQKGGQR